MPLSRVRWGFRYVIFSVTILQVQSQVQSKVQSLIYTVQNTKDAVFYSQRVTILYLHITDVQFK